MQIEGEEEVEEIIEGEQRARFRRQRLRIGDLAVERTCLPGGPTLPPVVLVHGFAQNRFSWHLSRRSPANWLAARGWDVWNLELRGHGRSRGRALSFQDYVDDVVAVAKVHEGRAFFVGHSLGGAAAYAAATLTPVRGVVGIGALFRFGQASGFLKLLGSMSHLGRKGWLGGLSVRTWAAAKVITSAMPLADAAGFGILPISGWWPGSMEPDLLEERLQKGFDWTSLQVWLDMSRWAWSNEPEAWQKAWRTTDVPLLVIAGDEDHLMPPDDARPAYTWSGSKDKTWLLMDDMRHEVHWGHLDLVLGRHALRLLWPEVDAWMRTRVSVGRPAAAR